MNKLKKVLFKSALNEYEKIKTDKNGISAYHFSALYEVIIQAGLDEEFQQYKIKHGG